MMVVGAGWSEFTEANGWPREDGGLRLAKLGANPAYAFERWVAIFPSGAWGGRAWRRGRATRAWFPPWVIG